MTLRVFVFALLALLPGALWGLPFGKFIVGAGVILDGGTLYRDFWTMYAPGSFWLVALLFRAFGDAVLVQAVAVVVLRALSAAVFFRLLRRVETPPRFAAALTAVFVGMLWDTAPELDSYPPALLLLLLATGRALDRRWVAAGVLCGIAAWFKHDVAAYMAAAFAIATIVSPAGGGRVRAVTRLALGAAVPVVPVAAVIALSAGAYAADCLFVFPATVFAQVFGERYPPFLPDFLPAAGQWLAAPADLRVGKQALGEASTWIMAHLPDLAVLGGAGFALLRRRRDPERARVTLLFAAPIPFFWMAAHVQRNTHVFSMAAFSLLIAALLWRDASRAGRAALAAVVGIYAAGLWTSPAMSLALAASQFRKSRTLDFPAARGIRVSRADAEVYGPIVERIRAEVPREEPIYAGVARHDAVVIGDLRFYYLTGRRGCSRYYELHPGIADAPDPQREIVRAIEEQRVQRVVLWRFGWPDATLDRIKRQRQRALPDLGATVLDEYLAEAFDPELSHGEYVLLRPRTR
ncbi:MAG: hypothetical protein ACT4PE_02665 [Candidatus Eiseniibacteriota bacterium]